MYYKNISKEPSAASGQQKSMHQWKRSISAYAGNNLDILETEVTVLV